MTRLRLDVHESVVTVQFQFEVFFLIDVLVGAQSWGIFGKGTSYYF